MNPYEAPRVAVGGENAPPSRGRRVLLLPVFAGLGLLSSAAAFVACRLVPLPAGKLAGASVVFIAALAAVAGAALLWKPLARTYGTNAFVAGAFVGLVPAALRLASLQRWPSSVFSQLVALIDTVGVVLAFALGAAIAARRMGANNSSKPTPLRGAA